MIREADPSVELGIVGEPHPREADREYATTLAGLAERVAPGAVTFAGYEPHIEDAYAAAWAVVNPARYEAFGRVAFEALMARRPVIATAVGGVPEVLRDGEDAILIGVDDPPALASAVIDLLHDEELARSMVAGGSRRVRAEFAPDVALGRFRDIVGAALAGSGSRP